jgi:hypothetical protein
VRLKHVIEKLKAVTRKPEPREAAPPEHVVPPPRSERVPEPPMRAPASYTTNSGLITDYPDRSQWEADVSRRAEDEIHRGKRPKRSKGPTTEAS